MIGQISEVADEAIPANSTSTRGKEVDLCTFLDSKHAGNKWSKMYKTGFITFINMSFIVGNPRSSLQ